MSRLLGVLALLLSVAAPAAATVVVPVDLAEMSREARAIARGRVIAVEGQWTEGRRGIETIVTLQVESYLKGQLGETTQFRVAGGTLGRFRSIVVGAPQFAVGQRVIVFLAASGPAIPHVIGFHQGVYRVNSGASGAVLVSPAPAVASAVPVPRGSESRVPVPLAEFEQRVRTLSAGALR